MFEGTKRIASVYNSKACQLISLKSNRNENIHQARLCCKRIRALLRFIMPAIGKDVFRAENDFYRDIARSLSIVRDLSALREAAASLVSKQRSGDGNDFLKKYMRSFREKEAKELNDSESCQESELLVAKLETGQARIAGWEPNIDEALIICKGIRRSFKCGKKGFQLSKSTRLDHDLHEWRKDVKYLWYMLYPLMPVWPPVISQHIVELKTLSTWLGNHHDMVMLDNAISSASGIVPGIKNSIRRSIAGRKRRAENAALQLGARLYAGGAKDFALRIKSYYELWKNESK